VFGVAAFIVAMHGQTAPSRFLLALFPLLVVLFGVAFLRQSGLTMAIVGLVLTIGLAVFQFGTPPEVALGASVLGFMSGFGISISVAVTMLMIFLMRETGALQTVSKVIKRQVVGNEVQALYIGIGFGSFLSCLGVVTPALFPPLLVTMGFSPSAAVAIAVLGYDPTTSFSLLSIPITLPVQVGAQMQPPIMINALAFAFKIAIFLPIVSTGFAFAILWLVGGKKSMRKGAIPALICGLALALACLGVTSLDYLTGVEYVPLRIVGVVAGLCAMASLYIYQKLKTQATQEPRTVDYPTRKEVWRSFSPWIALTILASTVSIPQIDERLHKALGGADRITIFADQNVDLKVFSQIYTWIFVAILVSLLTLRPTKKQVKAASKLWLRRFLIPFFTYGLYFSISYVMAFSAYSIVGGKLVLLDSARNMNMNAILGATLAIVFGAGYVFVAPYLGLFGAVVGGSETSSNVLFLSIQKRASHDIGLSDSGFMTVYGSHAVAGGIASAVTPAKINNAIVTIDAGKGMESHIMRKHLVVAILLTIATGILTGIFVNLGI
jgi:lactate permease